MGVVKMKVIILLNNTEVSKRATENYFKKLYKPDDHEVIVYHAIVPPSVPTIDLKSGIKFPVERITEIMEKHQTEETELECFLDEIVKQNTPGVKLAKIWKHADSTTMIGEQALDLANKHKADLVITGCRGLHGLKKHWLGSVSEFMIRNCNCAVLVNK